MRLLLTVLMLAQAAPKPAERPAPETKEVRKAADPKPSPRPVNYPRKMNF